MSKMGKEHTHTFWLITSLILNGFSIRKKFWKAETESFPTIPSNPMYVEAWEKNIQTHFYHTFLNMMSKIDQIHTKGCNAMYVEACRRWEKNIHTHFGS